MRIVPHNPNAARVVAFDSEGRFIWRGPVRENRVECANDVCDGAHRARVVNISDNPNYFEDSCFEFFFD